MLGSVNQSCYNCFRWGPKTQTYRCASALVQQSRIFHSINALCTFYRMHTFLNKRNILSWIPFGSDLDLNRVCKCKERERDWCRRIKVNIASAEQQVERERERERNVCVFFFEFRQFFSLWELVYIFQSFVSIFAKKSDRTRCLAISILGYNLGPQNYWVRGTILIGIQSRQSERKRFGFLKEEQNSLVIHR